MGKYTILVMGLPGSGKTTLAIDLAKALCASHHNADELRAMHNDWDFSIEGRLRQASRMRVQCIHTSSYYDVCDFVAALPKQREILNPDFIIWMNTIKAGRYEDTNKAFVPPDNYDLEVINFNYNLEVIVQQIVENSPR